MLPWSERIVLVGSLVVAAAACNELEGGPTILQPEPAIPGAPPMSVHVPPAAPGAVLSDGRPHPRCVRLEDGSGWTCSPAAASPEQLADLVAAAVGLWVDPSGYFQDEVSGVVRPAGALEADVAFFTMDESGDFGGVRAFVALRASGGWSYAAHAGTLPFSVNSDGRTQLVFARRDDASGLLVVETDWEGSDAACTEPLSWTYGERRSTVCDPAGPLCRTVSTSGWVIEERDNPWNESVRRRTTERFGTQLVLDDERRLKLRVLSGRAPRAVRRLERPTRLAAVATDVDPFER